MASGRRCRFAVVTLFPEMFEGPLSRSIVARARAKGQVEVGFVNPRDFAKDRHRTVDDRPYGGGAGMVLMAEPLYQAIRKAKGRRRQRVLMMSPQGRPFDQAEARRIAREGGAVLVCGHYEGVDERIADFVDGELSLGDFVLTGGEIPAMAVVDAVTRILPGVLAKDDAAARESFSGEKDAPPLDYPHYTRPSVWRGRKVPAELLSGDHARIEAWRRGAALDAARRKRPDLVKNAKITR
ncbi:MAG TPA: tRNA (guanosine(37)-N1)-methyltransferase TrmD [Elusimicrobiota bacterium]|jgi:tRNA (guanine37-N1)-methyltransferase|nr:tRNA (guanosine(37)-N1)-methyltransferase TrmD [Elusimicrobiota bacterium]